MQCSKGLSKSTTNKVTNSSGEQKTFLLVWESFTDMFGECNQLWLQCQIGRIKDTFALLEMTQAVTNQTKLERRHLCLGEKHT